MAILDITKKTQRAMVFLTVEDENGITVYSNFELCRNQSRDFTNKKVKLLNNLQSRLGF